MILNHDEVIRNQYRQTLLADISDILCHVTNHTTKNTSCLAMPQMIELPRPIIKPSR
jgi:hypothetical protein